MHLAGAIAAIAALPSIAAQLSIADIVIDAIANTNTLNGTANNFANDTSFIAAGDSFYSGTLYNVSLDLVALTTFATGAQMIYSWFPRDSNDTDAGEVYAQALTPVLQQINNGVANIYNTAENIPINGNPLGALLGDLSDVFSRLVTAMNAAYPTEATWLNTQLSTLQGNIGMAQDRMNSSTATEDVFTAVPVNKREVQNVHARQYWGWDFCGFGGSLIPGCKVRKPTEAAPAAVAAAAPVEKRSTNLIPCGNSAINDVACPVSHVQTERQQLVRELDNGYPTVEECAEQGYECIVINLDDCICLD